MNPIQKRLETNNKTAKNKKWETNMSAWKMGPPLIMSSQLVNYEYHWIICDQYRVFFVVFANEAQANFVYQI